ncbi:hypothetical protein BH23ACT9_BH23ACT9_28350 [soil metagenome]
MLLSSVLVFQGNPWTANYAAAKAYVQSLAEGIGVELRPHGIDVLAAAPGPTSSGFAQRTHMVMGRTLDPDDVAGSILHSSACSRPSPGSRVTSGRR